MFRNILFGLGLISLVALAVLGYMKWDQISTLEVSMLDKSESEDNPAEQMSEAAINALVAKLIASGRSDFEKQFLDLQKQIATQQQTIANLKSQITSSSETTVNLEDYVTKEQLNDEIYNEKLVQTLSEDIVLNVIKITSDPIQKLEQTILELDEKVNLSIKMQGAIVEEQKHLLDFGSSKDLENYVTKKQLKIALTAEINDKNKGIDNEETVKSLTEDITATVIKITSDPIQKLEQTILELDEKVNLSIKMQGAIVEEQKHLLDSGSSKNLENYVTKKQLKIALTAEIDDKNKGINNEETVKNLTEDITANVIKITSDPIQKLEQIIFELDEKVKLSIKMQGAIVEEQKHLLDFGPPKDLENYVTKKQLKIALTAEIDDKNKGIINEETVKNLSEDITANVIKITTGPFQKLEQTIFDLDKKVSLSIEIQGAIVEEQKRLSDLISKIDN